MHYHLIGICGTAMASLAGMLQARGHKVTGSDQNVYPPMSTQLAALGIELMQGYKAENADLPRDVTIIGNTIMRGNPELEEVLNRKFLYRSQAETVRDVFIRRSDAPPATAGGTDNCRHSLVVAGTHGKTTTTSLAAWMCEVGGLDPTFLVGGVVQNFGQSFRVTDSDYFVIEGDEYDTAFFDKKPKFMSYLPEIAIVNNIEFDHADIYKDLDAIKWQFSRLMNLVPGNGRLICGIDSLVVGEVLDQMKGKLHTTVETFGLSDNAKWQARDIEFSAEGTRFNVYKKTDDQRSTINDKPWATFKTKMIGEFNVRNCLAVIIAADAWGISQAKMQECFDTFESVKRRMEVRGVERGVTVIDDFAHHPTAVDETLKALRQRYASNRLIAVFEPRSRSSRLSVFEQQYKKAFEHADVVLIAGVFNPEDAKTYGEVLDVPKLVAEIAATGKTAMTLADADAIVEHLAPQMTVGDVIAVMSNGGFGGIHDKLLSVLRG